MSLFAVSLISSCTTTPSSPKPHKTKYTFQCLSVSLPEAVLLSQAFKFDDNVFQHDFAQPPVDDDLFREKLTHPSQQGIKSPIPILTHLQIEEILKNPDAEILEFPIVYAGIGESVTNDQTKVISMAIDAEVIDGKVIYTKEPYKFGKEVSITVNKVEVEGNTVTYQLNMMSQKFIGFDEYKTKEGLIIKMPYFEGRGTHTEITQEPCVWIVMGGLMHQRDDGPKMNEIFCIRIIPPITNK